MIHGVTHGEAVCYGILIADYIAVQEGILDGGEADRIRNLFLDLGLVKKIELDKKEIIGALRKDKKREQEHIHFIVLDKIGSARLWECDLEKLDSYLMAYPGVNA